MTCFDLDLVEKILLEENEKRKIVSACLYLEGDEIWNSTIIIANNKFKRHHYGRCYGGSFWASPRLELTYLIDNEEFEKTFYVGKKIDDSEFDGNCVETWIANTEIYKKLGLELEDV